MTNRISHLNDDDRPRRGHPYHSWRKNLEQAFCDAVTDNEFEELVEQLLQRAEAGHLPAIDLTMRKVFNKARMAPLPPPDISEEEAADPIKLAAAVLEGRCAPESAKVLSRLAKLPDSMFEAVP